MEKPWWLGARSIPSRAANGQSTWTGGVAGDDEREEQEPEVFDYKLDRARREPPARGRPARRLLVRVRRPARVPRPPLARRCQLRRRALDEHWPVLAWTTAAIRAYLVCVLGEREFF